MQLGFRPRLRARPSLLDLISKHHIYETSKPPPDLWDDSKEKDSTAPPPNIPLPTSPFPLPIPPVDTENPISTLNMPSVRF